MYESLMWQVLTQLPTIDDDEVCLRSRSWAGCLWCRNLAPHGIMISNARDQFFFEKQNST